MWQYFLGALSQGFSWWPCTVGADGWSSSSVGRGRCGGYSQVQTGSIFKVLLGRVPIPSDFHSPHLKASPRTGIEELPLCVWGPRSESADLCLCLLSLTEQLSVYARLMDTDMNHSHLVSALRTLQPQSPTACLEPSGKDFFTGLRSKCFAEKLGVAIQKPKRKHWQQLYRISTPGTVLWLL